jgi:hypothetical protein
MQINYFLFKLYTKNTILRKIRLEVMQAPFRLQRICLNGVISPKFQSQINRTKWKLILSINVDYLWIFREMGKELNVAGECMYVPTLSAWTRGRDTESIEWFIEGQVFSPSYDAVSSTATHTKTEKERQVADRRGGEGVDEEPNHTTGEKSGLCKSFNILWLESGGKGWRRPQRERG